MKKRDRFRSLVRVVLHPLHLRRTLTITVIVGTWLTLFNQADVLLGEGLSEGVAFKIVLNYLTPFVVSNLGLLSHVQEQL